MFYLGLYLLANGSCATTGAVSAEEYYSLGMAYFDLGKFEEAERWLNRARTADKTQTASEYNLGRIAFEMGRYQEAAARFEGVLARDPVNVMALKAAAYTRIKTGELEAAEELYRRVLALSPESADDGYNFALVLFALKKYDNALDTLSQNQFALKDNKDVLLLYARTQKALGRVEAADSYAQWLDGNADPVVQYEYAQVLEQGELYARALEAYRAGLTGLAADSAEPSRGDLRFAIARVLIIADPDNPEAMTELTAAITDGYKDFDAIEKLAATEGISAALRDEINAILDRTRRAAADLEAEAGEAGL
jgi:tetratricopeptide (TPR) repeat protein